MTTCKDCRYWQQKTYDYPPRVVTECGAADGSGQFDDIDAAGFAVYADCRGDTWAVNSGLKTGPDFGCTKGQPK